MAPVGYVPPGRHRPRRPTGPSTQGGSPGRSLYCDSVSGRPVDRIIDAAAQARSFRERTHGFVSLHRPIHRRRPLAQCQGSRSACDELVTAGRRLHVSESMQLARNSRATARDERRLPCSRHGMSVATHGSGSFAFDSRGVCDPMARTACTASGCLMCFGARTRVNVALSDNRISGVGA